MWSTRLTSTANRAPGWARRGPGLAAVVPALAISGLLLTGCGPAASPSGASASNSADPAGAPSEGAVTSSGSAAAKATRAAKATASKTRRPAAKPRKGTALALLAKLPVKGRAPKTGYDRDRFGQAWADVDRNGCDTRNDILRRDLTALSAKPGTRDCVITSGTLRDPYRGVTIRFVRGEQTSRAVQIDHVVALSDAWQKGAQRLDPATRTRLANDPINLLAVDGPTNLRKGDSDAASWLPPNKGFRCRYVARQVSVKAHYRLWVTSAEKAAMARVLAGCPDEPALTSGARVALATSATAKSSSAAPSRAPQSTKRRTAKAVYYENCAAARAAGAAPVHRGDPGYGSHLDRDDDGVGCE